MLHQQWQATHFTDCALCNPVIQSSPSVNIYLITGLLLQYHKSRASIRRVRKAEPGRVGTIHVQTKVAETKHNVASKWDHFLQNEEDFHVRHISFISAPQLRRIVELFPLQVFPRGELCWLQWHCRQRDHLKRSRHIRLLSGDKDRALLFRPVMFKFQ